MRNMSKETDAKPEPVKKETKRCTCSESIGRNIRCPLHGDLDKI